MNHINISLNYEITNRREGDVEQLYAATDVAKEKLGWKAKRNLEDRIRSSWKGEQNFRK